MAKPTQPRRTSVTTAQPAKKNPRTAPKMLPRTATTKKKAVGSRPQDNPIQPTSKIGATIRLLRGAEGASMEDLMKATGWQGHSMRGAISGSIKRRLGLNVDSDKPETVRFYRITHKTGA
jgi:hypothetical protein